MRKQTRSKAGKSLSSPSKATPSAGNLFFYMIVTLSGGAVMILELLGTRIIAPFYGVSLYVWSALIAVTLIALALGYYFGGYCADRFHKLRLAHVILAAALSTLIIPFISGPVLSLTNALGIRSGAFASAFILFTMPLTALAMVGPYVIKQATQNLQGVGTAAGSVYAISTVGSVLGTLLLSYFLLPQFGTRTIIFCLSVMLMILSIVLVLQDKQGISKPWYNIPFLVMLILAGTLAFGAFAKSSHKAHGFKVLHEKESIYGWVRVVDDEKYGFRLLLSNASVLSAMKIAHGKSLLGCQTILGLLPLFRPAAAEALVIGLGGGHVASDLKSKGIVTDTIEIDPAVADASMKYYIRDTSTY